MNDNLLKRKIIIISGAFILVLLGCYFLYIYYNDLKEETKEITLEKESDSKIVKTKTQKKEETIKVDIKGEVKRPSIYSATVDERIIDIIEKAGGLTKKADTSMINLSKKVKDEMVIIIYSKEEIRNYEKTKEKEQEKRQLCDTEVKNDACIEEKDTVGEDTSQSTTTGLININTATLEQLQTLPSVGENKAKNIIRYREEHNGFKTIEEVKNVSGIGDSIFDKIKDYITIE